MRLMLALDHMNSLHCGSGWLWLSDWFIVFGLEESRCFGFRVRPKQELRDGRTRRLWLACWLRSVRDGA